MRDTTTVQRQVIVVEDSENISQVIQAQASSGTAGSCHFLCRLPAEHYANFYLRVRSKLLELARLGEVLTLSFFEATPSTLMGSAMRQYCCELVSSLNAQAHRSVRAAMPRQSLSDGLGQTAIRQG